MHDSFGGAAERLAPYVVQRELNEPVTLISGPLSLLGPQSGVLDSNLVFRWAPSTAVEFEGSYSEERVDTSVDVEWHLGLGETGSQVPVFLTEANQGPPTIVRGFASQPFNLGNAPFDVLRFSLANFPQYRGSPVRFERDGASGVAHGRLQVEGDMGVCRLDEVAEARELNERARRGAGFVVSHVGEWIPSSGNMTADEAAATLDMLRLWFGLLRGAWCGPLFPQGLIGDEVVWRQIAGWYLGVSRRVPVWLPQRAQVDLAPMFAGFVRRWSNVAWREPLRSAISWLVEANSPQVVMESKIILSQVALETLAWVHIVETQRLHSRADFGRLTAAGRVRALLQVVGIPMTVPDHMTLLPILCDGDSADGPGVITRVRNALVHATEEKRSFIEAIDDPTRYQCSQLGLQYLELCLLGICGYGGKYAQRGWRGRILTDDEVQVPWAE